MAVVIVTVNPKIAVCWKLLVSVSDKSYLTLRIIYNAVCMDIVIQHCRAMQHITVLCEWLQSVDAKT